MSSCYSFFQIQIKRESEIHLSLLIKSFIREISKPNENWEAVSDQIGTLLYGCKGQHLVCEFKVDLSLGLSYIHISFLFKLRHNFFLKGFFSEPLFSERQPTTPTGHKSFEQLFHIFWGDSHHIQFFKHNDKLKQKSNFHPYTLKGRGIKHFWGPHYISKCNPI